MDSPRSSPNSAISPLSSLSSEDFAQEIKPEELDGAEADRSPLRLTRPAKRQRTGPSWDARREMPDPVRDDDTYVSSDTDGSVLGSPGHAANGAQDEEALGLEQVSVCKWDGCDVGETGNMDQLVEHIHEDHIGARRQKYSCEWVDCPRKGIPHASGYALRAHMRSHTREKPFYCTLPECDRSFTRSDALAKHMRTVHETDMRPDPISKSQPVAFSNRLQRVRLTFKANSASGLGGQSGSDGNQAEDGSEDPTESDPNNISYEHVSRVTSSHKSNGPLAQSNPSYRVVFPPDVQFSPEETSLPADQLFRLLRRQQAWAERDAADLKADLDGLEGRRQDEWLAKELVLENVMEAELAVGERRAGRRRRLMAPEELEEEEVIAEKVRADAESVTTLTIDRGVPWWRREAQEQSMGEHQGADVKDLGIGKGQ